jgi:hypothetical protein
MKKNVPTKSIRRMFFAVANGMGSLYQRLSRTCFLVLTWSSEPELGVELEGAASETE